MREFRMNTDKKIISLYNFLKKEGFNDEANLVIKAFSPPAYTFNERYNPPHDE